MYGLSSRGNRVRGLAWNRLQSDFRTSAARPAPLPSPLPDNALVLVVLRVNPLPRPKQAIVPPHTHPCFQYVLERRGSEPD
jgi:hypothetical protein